jgi:ubiquinone/menaquinone biosynthesis C-methylase UbiE
LVWYIISAIVLALIGFLVWLALRPMTLPRDPNREGEQKGQAVTDYANMGRGPLFRFERFLVMHSLKQLKPGGVMVDIGSGPGYLAYALKHQYPRLKLIGLDINAEMLNFAIKGKTNKERGLELVLADAEQLPIAGNSLDFAVTSLSMHHWANSEQVFREIKRVLKPGGQFLVFDLRRNSPRLFYWIMVVGQYMSPPAIRRTNGGVGSFWASYTPSEIHEIITSADFSQFKIETHFGWMVAIGRKPEIC